ncbi:MAG: hypothetical protein K2O18_13345, partial [Oscillospiraceae bacterium]|nr:hypothetical protein [Oscillospiraceae bacterium]
AFITFIVQTDARRVSIGTGFQKIGFIAAVAVLVLNYAGWLLYFHGYQSFAAIMFFIVLLPPLYYVCIGLWRENWALFVTAAVFEIVHFVHVSGNLKM